MNLKLKRLVRTTSSEQYALYDLDLNDESQQPVTIGKLDLHYTAEGMYGTLLLWGDEIRQWRPKLRRSLVRTLLDEVAAPMGVPKEYVVEFFAPTLEGYEVFHNLDGEDEGSHERTT